MIEGLGDTVEKLVIVLSHGIGLEIVQNGVHGVLGEKISQRGGGKAVRDLIISCIN